MCEQVGFFGSYPSVGASSVFSPLLPAAIKKKSKLRERRKKLYLSGKGSIAAPSGSSPAACSLLLPTCLITNSFLN